MGRLCPRQRRGGAVFAVQVQTLWPIRVSRYNVDRVQVTSQGTVVLLEGTGAVAV